LWRLCENIDAEFTSNRSAVMSATQVNTNNLGSFVRKGDFRHKVVRGQAALKTRLLGVVMAGLAAFTLGMAASTQAATAETILTVTHTATAGGAAVKTEYDLAALQALPKSSFETKTEWTEGVQTFEGVEVQALMAALGVTGGTMSAIAADGYLVEIPAAEMMISGPIVAYSMNGAALPADKGPLWIVYPYDRAPEFNTEDTVSRSIWALQQIEFTP
jgi:hypothetical protein